MKRMRRYGSTLLATTSLVTIVLLVTGWGSALAAQVSSVLVANTSSNPVPVQAVDTVPVHEQGTASVNVGNFPSTQQVGGSVSVSNLPATQQVSGTVGIASGSNGVQEANSVAVHPFRVVGGAPFGAGNPGAFNAVKDLFTVPAGERVVVTYASMWVNVPADEHALVHLSNLAGEFLAFIPLIDAGNFNVSAPSEFLNGSCLVSLVYNPGEHIVVRAFRSEGDGDAIGGVEASLTGYTVPIP